MQLLRESDDRLRMRDDPAGFSRRLGFVLAALVAAVLLAVLLGDGSLLGGGLALVVAAGLWLALKRSEIATEAVFDRAAGRWSLRQLRDGREISRREGPLDAIEDVVVQASGRSQRVDRRLALRPALVVGERPLPLTYAHYARGERAPEIARTLRDFLGLPEGDLMEASLRVAARDPLRVNPAIRLARLGKGLDRGEAARLVKRLRAELGPWPEA